MKDYTENNDIEILTSPFITKAMLGSIARRVVFSIKTVDGSIVKLVISSIYIDDATGERTIQGIEIQDDITSSRYLPNVLIYFKNVSYIRFSEDTVYKHKELTEEQASSVMHRTDKLVTLAKEIIFGNDSE